MITVPNPGGSASGAGSLPLAAAGFAPSKSGALPPTPPTVDAPVNTTSNASPALAPAAALPATSVVATATTQALSLSQPASPPVSAGTIGAGLLLAALAVVALVGARKRRRASRMVEIVETASLGPKRSLVVARLGGEILLLGASEGGVALLATRPAPAPAPVAADAAEVTAAPAQRVESDVASRLAAFFKPRQRPAATAPARFEALLAESVEDAELRRKLAAGHVGSVR
jgi:flagellar biogenesis protein FliO